MISFFMAEYKSTVDSCHIFYVKILFAIWKIKRKYIILPDPPSLPLTLLCMLTLLPLMFRWLCAYPAPPTPAAVLKKTHFILWRALVFIYSFIAKNQLTVAVQFYFWVLCSILSVYVSVWWKYYAILFCLCRRIWTMLLLYCYILLYCYTSSTALFCPGLLWLFRVFVILY